MRTPPLRETVLFAGLAVVIAAVFAWLGAAYSVRMLTEAACYAIIALGLTIQWGYAGLFNVGLMGFVALAAFMTVLVSYPVNWTFWEGDGPILLGQALLTLVVGIAITWGLSRSHRHGVPKWMRTLLTLVAAAITYLAVQGQLDPAATLIEREAGFVGGFGLPVWAGWVAGGLVAGLLGWAMGRITLGLRAESTFQFASMQATAKAMLGWQHAFGDVTPTSVHAFAGGAGFTIAGSPIARDTALIEAGLDFDLTPKTTLGVSYRDKMVDEDAFEDLFAYTFLGGAGSFSVFWQNGSYLSSNLIYRDYEYKGTRADEFWYSRVAYGVPITELTGDKAAWLDPVLVELAATRSDRSSNQTVFDFDSYGGEFRLIYRF